MRNYDVVVVGGGRAGLTCAAYLAKSGKRVLLVEKNKECGGLVNSFEHNGFVFDAGVKGLLNAGIVLPMLRQLDISLEYTRSKVSVGIQNEIIHIETKEDLESYRNLLLRFYPESEKEVVEIIRDIKKMMKYFDVLYGIDNPVFRDLKNDFVFRQLVPWLPKFLFTIINVNRLNKPVEVYLAKKVKNRSLLDMIVQHFFKNTPTFFALGYFSLYLNYFYPKGGIGKLGEVIQKKVCELGGEIRTERRIVEVHPVRKSVKDDQGEEYGYERLVWASDLKTLYRMIAPEELPKRIQKAFCRKKEEMFRHRGNDSVFTVFLEVDEPVETFQSISHGHFFYTPSREGMGDIARGELENILSHFDDFSKEDVLKWSERFLTYNTFEISLPAIRDSGLAPEGKTGIVVSVMAEYELFKKVRQAGWLDEFVSFLEKKVVELLSRTVYPMLEQKLIHAFSFTPLDIEKRVGSSEGAIVGWAFDGNIPVVKNMLKVNDSVLTPIPDIFQAGQWVYSPSGVPMAILTGKIAVQRVMNSLRKK